MNISVAIYLQPSLSLVWNKHQAEIMKQLKCEKRGLVLGGDGRADSPGHSAKFGSYTLMELKKRVVIDVQLVQVSGSIPYTLPTFKLHSH